MSRYCLERLGLGDWGQASSEERGIRLEIRVRRERSAACANGGSMFSFREQDFLHIAELDSRLGLLRGDYHLAGEKIKGEPSYLCKLEVAVVILSSRYLTPFRADVMHHVLCTYKTI